MTVLLVAQLAEMFEKFADLQCVDNSPFYAHLSRGIARDESLLRLAARAGAGQPIPNMLLGAVHYLLLNCDRDDPLARHYPGPAASPAPQRDAMPAFRAFCDKHDDAISEILRTRVVSTNEVLRCACLLPGFAAVAARAGESPMHIIEVGASAGLNLLWDRYRYDYGLGRTIGDPDASLVLKCTLRGGAPLAVGAALPVVGERIGIDVSPIDAANERDCAWLRALVWPEQRERARRLMAALEIARHATLVMREGDGVDLIADAVRGLPGDGVVCIYHSFTLNQFSQAARARFDELLVQLGRERPVYRLALEWGARRAAELSLTIYAGSSIDTGMLAHCDAHGAWLELRG